MCRIALIAHAPLASAWLACATHILGKTLGHALTQVQCVDIAPDVDLDAATEEVIRRLACLPNNAPGSSPNLQDAGTLILCDVVGATPFNIAQRAAGQLQAGGQDVALLAGANLCMLLKAITHNAEHNAAGAAISVQTLADQALQSAHASMVQASPAFVGADVARSAPAC